MAKTFPSAHPYKALEDSTASPGSLAASCALEQACGILVGLRSLLPLISAEAHEVLSGCVVMETGRGTGSFPCRPFPPLPGCGAGGAGLFTQTFTAAHKNG